MDAGNSLLQRGRPSHINTYIRRERGVEEESGGDLFYESL
jgi:hypothetical protein